MSKKKVHLNDIVEQMTSGRGRTGLSFNELLNKVQEAKDDNVDVIIEEPVPDYDENTSIEQQHPVPNNIVTDNENYYNNIPFNSMNYNGDKAEQMRGYIDNYIQSQLEIVDMFNTETTKQLQGYYNHLDPYQFNQYKYELINTVTSNHYRLLNDLGLYLQSLTIEEQIMYHRLAIEKQVEYSYKMQYHLSSPEKKNYDAQCEHLQASLADIQSKINANGDPATIHELNNIYNNLMVEYSDVSNQRHQYMDQCSIAHRGYSSGLNYQGFDNQNNVNNNFNQNQYSGNQYVNQSNDPFVTGASTVYSSNDDPFGNGNTIGIGYDGGGSNINLGQSPIAQEQPMTERSGNMILNMIRPESLTAQGKTLDNSSGYFVSAADSEFDKMVRNTEEVMQYSPYYGESCDKKYSNQFNYLADRNGVMGMNNIRNNTQNLASSKNAHIREMRRIGYVPELFGVPEGNEDYVMQLLWTIPIPDPTEYDDRTEAPIWYLTPDILGYLDYVDANSSIVKAHKSDKNPLGVKIIRFDKMTEDEKVMYYKEKEMEQKALEEKEKEDSKIKVKVRILTAEDLEKQERIREEEERLKEEKRLNSIEFKAPDFTDPQYVAELDALEYVPDVVLKFFNTKLTPSMLYEFCVDGIMYINKYQQFTYFVISNELDKVKKAKIDELEQELIDAKTTEVRDKTYEQVGTVAKAVSEEFGMDDVDLSDLDTLTQIRELALSKMEEEDVPPPKPVEKTKEELEAEEAERQRQEELLNEIPDDPDLLYDMYGVRPDDDMLPYDPDDEKSILDYLEAKQKAIEDYERDIYESKGMSYDNRPTLYNGLTLGEACGVLDTDRIENDIDKLRSTLEENLHATQFDGMTLDEKIMYLRDQINGGIYEAYDVSKLKPGIHKFYTSNGIYVLDNRDLSVKQSFDTRLLSPEKYQRSYYRNNEQSYSAFDVLMNSIVLPKQKPVDKKIYKDPYSDYDAEGYLDDLQIINKHDEIALFKWKTENVHPYYTMSNSKLKALQSYDRYIGEYKDITGLDPATDEITSYADWAERTNKYYHIMNRRGKNSKAAVEIYDVVSQYDYNQNRIEMDQQYYSNPMSDQQYGDPYLDYQIAPRQFDMVTIDTEPFDDRSQYTCNMVSNNKCYSTFTSGQNDMTPKTPPIQYMGTNDDGTFNMFM